VEFSPYLKTLARESVTPLARESEAAVRDLADLVSSLPANYRWRMTPSDTFLEETQRLVRIGASAAQLNALYWRDMARSMEAYNLHTVWRTHELVVGTLELLERHQFIGPAVMARALVELTTSFILNSSQIRTAVTISEPDWMDSVVVVNELEEILHRSVFGTRLPGAPEHQEARNVLTGLKRLSALSGYEPVLSTYEYLCEVAHPNLVGNARYWLSTPERRTDGTVLYSMERDAEDTDYTRTLTDNVLFTVGWSAANAQAGFGIIREQVATILGAFPSDP